jgi:hypothetical protein
MKPRSKLTAEREVIRRILLDLNDRRYPAPVFKARKRGADESWFKLQFMWNVDNSGEKVAFISEDQMRMKSGQTRCLNHPNRTRYPCRRSRSLQ